MVAAVASLVGAEPGSLYLLCRLFLFALMAYVAQLSHPDGAREARASSASSLSCWCYL